MNTRKLAIGSFVFGLVCFYGFSGFAQGSIGNSKYNITWPQKDVRALTYRLKKNGAAFKILLPSFEIDNHTLPAVLSSLKSAVQPVILKNKVTEYVFEGAFEQKPYR